MCGFFGIINSKTKINLSAPWNAVSWRGNVHGGWHANNCAILASRLPRSGDRKRPQPVVVNNNNVFSLNGEIYNIDELKCMALKANISFASDLSDAEALGLIIAYSVDRNEVIKKIRGEFALAFYDNELCELILSRDLMGTKPLYWAESQGSISFGSSAKAVSLTKRSALNPDWLKIQNIFEFGVTPSANIFQDIESIAAGEIKTFKFSKQIFTSYSVVNKPFQGGSIFNDLNRAVSSRYKHGKTALAFSGGVDSSLIRQLKPEMPCYTLLLKEKKLLHKQRGVLVTQVNLLASLEKMWSFIDRPFSTLSPVAMCVLTEEMNKDGIENMLTGEGADELFGGYPHLFQNMTGHPILSHHKLNFDIASRLLKLHLTMESPFFQSLLNTRTSSDWLIYDRWIRLPQHLTLLHTDCPSLINRIEARLPFLDIVHHGIIDPQQLKIPKKPLRDMLNAYPFDLNETIPLKEGLFIPCGIFRDELLLEICDQNFDNLYPYIPFDFRKTCEKTLNKIAAMPDSAKDTLRELVARTIIQVSTIPHLLWKQKQESEVPNRYISLGMNSTPTICTSIT